VEENARESATKKVKPLFSSPLFFALEGISFPTSNCISQPIIRKLFLAFFPDTFFSLFFANSSVEDDVSQIFSISNDS